MKRSIRLGRLFGIEIGAHISWTIIVVLVTLSLASYFAETEMGWSPVLRWSAALITALLFFASVVAHELAHSLVAIRYGIQVRSITLFLFGGVSQIESEAKRPSEEFWIAIAGPLTSVAVGALSALVLVFAPMSTFIGAIAGWLSGVNIGLAIFNMLPGFPLDGGRVLRSLVWFKTGDMRRATRIAAGVGQAIALLMILGGIWMFVRPNGNFSGLWLSLIGWFLFDASRASTDQIELEQMLRKVTAADLMSIDCQLVSADLPVPQFIDDYLMRSAEQSFVVAENGHVLGIITPKEIQSVNRLHWPLITVGQIMRPFNRLKRVTPDTSADQVLKLMMSEKADQLPVIAGDKFLGIITREQIMRYLATRKDFGGDNRGSGTFTGSNRRAA